MMCCAMQVILVLVAALAVPCFTATTTPAFYAVSAPTPTPAVLETTMPAASASGFLAPQVGVVVSVAAATTTVEDGHVVWPSLMDMRAKRDETAGSTPTPEPTPAPTSAPTPAPMPAPHSNGPRVHVVEASSPQAQQKSVQDSSHGRVDLMSMEKPQSTLTVSTTLDSHVVEASSAQARQKPVQDSSHGRVDLMSMEKPQSTLTVSTTLDSHVVEASSAQARQKQVQDSSRGRVALKSMEKPQRPVGSHGSVVSASRGHEETHHPAWNLFACILLVLGCLGCFFCLFLVALICAKWHYCFKKSPARAIDNTKVVPQHERSTSPLLFRDLTRESTVTSELDDDKKRTESDITALPQLPADISGPEVPKVQSGVPLIWETTDGERTVYATRKPLGVQFRAEFPLKVKREPVGHGKDLGIEVGWILKCVNGIDVTMMTDIRKVNEVLYREVGEKTLSVEQWNGIPLTWDTPKGPRTVYATKKPLGVQFSAEFPLKIKRNPVGHGKDLGLEVGWILTRVNGIDVTAMTDISKVSEILYREVGEKTVPVEQWTK